MFGQTVRLSCWMDVSSPGHFIYLTLSYSSRRYRLSSFGTEETEATQLCLSPKSVFMPLSPKKNWFWFGQGRTDQMGSFLERNVNDFVGETELKYVDPVRGG